MQWSPMLDLCWQRDTYSDIGRSILPLTWIEFQRLRLKMIRRTFNIRPTAKPHQLLWESRPIPGGGNTFYTGGCNSPFYWQQPDSFAFLFTTKGPGWRSETSKRTTWRRLLSLHTFHCQWQVVMKNEKIKTEKMYVIIFYHRSPLASNSSGKLLVR